MIFEIDISAQADADLRGIYEYIGYELQSPENAHAQLDRLEEGIMNLDQMPERFREYKRSHGIAVDSELCQLIIIVSYTSPIRKIVS